MAVLVLVGAKPPRPEQGVELRLQSWLKAQNDGDFKAYEALYATRFTGIKRAGTRVSRFDRRGWMADRAKMFRHAVTVSATDTVLKPSGAAVSATFTQAWASKSFADRGKKRQIWTVEDGAWKISREEMLGSEVSRGTDASPSTTEPGSARLLRFAWVAAGGAIVQKEPDLSWAAKGRPPTMEVGVPTVATREVDIKKLPQDLQALVGRKVVGLEDDGAPCAATVTGFKLVSRSIPHFGQREEWATLPPAEVAEEFWDSGAIALIATVPGCGSAVWVRSAELGTPKTYDVVDLSDTAKKRVRDAFKALPAYRTIAKDFAAEYPKDGDWDTTGTASTTAYNTSDGVVISVSGTYDDAGCGGFHAYLWAAFKEEGGQLILLNVPGDSNVIPSPLVSEVEGTLNFFYQGFTTSDFDTEWGRLAPVNGKFTSVNELKVPYWDCPC